jgi:hypothetical protein
MSRQTQIVVSLDKYHKNEQELKIDMDSVKPMTILDLKYKIAQMMSCDLMAVRSYTVKNDDVVDVIKHNNLRIDLFPSSGYLSFYEQMAFPDFGYVFLSKNDIEHLKKHYEYKRPFVEVDVVIRGRNDWRSDHCYYFDPIKKKIRINPFCTFEDLENLVVQELVECKICSEQEIKRTLVKQDREHTFTIKCQAIGIDKAKLRSVASTFCSHSNGTAAADYDYDARRSTYCDVPILNRVKTGDLVEIQCNIMQGSFVNIVCYWRNDVGGRAGQFSKQFSLEQRLSDIISKAEKKSRYFGYCDPRKIDFFVCGKQLQEKDFYQPISKHFDSDDIKVTIVFLEHVPVSKLRDDEVTKKAEEIVSDNFTCVSSRYSSSVSTKKLYDSRSFMNDLEIVICEQSWPIMTTMFLLKTDMSDENLFVLWFKNRDKFADTKEKTMTIDVSTSPFETFDEKQHDFCMNIIVQYAYSCFDVKTVFKQDLLCNLHCLHTWAHYFGFTSLVSLIDKICSIDVIKEFYLRKLEKTIKS